MKHPSAILNFPCWFLRSNCVMSKSFGGRCSRREAWETPNGHAQGCDHLEDNTETCYFLEFWIIASVLFSRVNFFLFYFFLDFQKRKPVIFNNSLSKSQGLCIYVFMFLSTNHVCNSGVDCWNLAIALRDQRQHRQDRQDMFMNLMKGCSM